MDGIASVLPAYLFISTVFSDASLVCLSIPGNQPGFDQIEHWLGGFIFLGTFGASFTAVGIFASSVTKNQMVAGMLTFILLTLYLTVMAFSLESIVMALSLQG